MKKLMTSLLIAAMTFSVTACTANNTSGAKDQTVTEAKAEGSLKTAQDITEQSITDATVPARLLEKVSAFRVKRTFENTGDSVFDGAVVESTFAKNGEISEINEISTYTDGYVSNVYFSNDPSDCSYYMTCPGATEVSEIEKDFADGILNESFCGYLADDLKLTDVKEENGLLIAELEYYNDGEIISNDTITIDSKTGLVKQVVSSYGSVKGEGNTTCTFDFDYSENVSIDYSAKTENGAAAGETTGASSNEQNTNLFAGAVDMNGNPVSEDLLKDSKLVLLNYWEPWCGPCVKEMPDLQKLYDDYKDKGLLIIGVYSSTDMQSDAEAIAEKNSITYPLLKSNETLNSLAQDYYPATYFLDGEGKVLTAEPYAGARSYEEWEEIVKSYLGA